MPMRERFEIDPAHTVIGFSTKHLAVTTVRGQLAKFSGWFEGDQSDPSDVRGEVTVYVQSITTGVDQRDTHLRSGDFFESETYPTITFQLTAVEPAGNDDYRVRGELTMKGTTRPIALDAKLEGETPDPFGSGGRRLGVSLTGQLNRKDFGLNWDGLAGTVPLAGNLIKLQIDAELVAQAIEVAPTG